MAGSKSDFLENEVLDHVLGNAAYSAPATVYAALFTSSPSDAGGGTEVATGSYARVAITNNATNWPAAAGGSKSNGTAITFPTATANWGTIVAVGIFDASTGGNLLFWATLTNSRTVFTSDVLTFPAGSFIVTED